VNTTAFGQLGAGDKLVIQSYRNTKLDLTVQSDATETPHLKFLTVMVNNIQGNDDFVADQTALLFTAELGDVPVEEVAEHFQGEVECTSIGEGHWVCLVQGESVGILRIKFITIEK